VCLSVDEEISAMRRELDKYGIQMPAFSKIGGMLANEVSSRFNAFSLSLLSAGFRYTIIACHSTVLSFSALLLSW